MRRTAVLICALLGGAAAASADDDVINPDRPGIADGSATVSRGVFQIETGVERDDQDSEHSLATPTLLRYGLTDSFELRLETNGYERDSSGGGEWAPLSIGFKKHFREHPSLGIIGRLSDEATGDLRFAADLQANDKWAFNPNIGVAFEKDGGRFTALLAALTVQYNFSDAFNAFVDGALQSPEERSGASSVLVDTGIAWIIGRRTQLDFSAGWGAHGNTAPDVFWSAGISRAF